MNKNPTSTQDHINGKEEKETFPIFSILAQYVKDLSFENPHAPESLRPRDKAPQIDVNVNVAANPIQKHHYEVTLTVHAKATNGGQVLFNAELIYGGSFHLENIPEEHVTPLLFIECPRLLFPFARQILADATHNGGFPPLYLDPIDFAGLYQQRMQSEAQGTQH